VTRQSTGDPTDIESRIFAEKKRNTKFKVLVGSANASLKLHYNTNEGERPEKNLLDGYE